MIHFITRITFVFITCLGFSQSYTSKIDSIVSLNYSDNEPGITILVAKNGNTLYSKANKTSSENKKAQQNRKSVDVPLEILKKYVGSYEVKPNVNLTIGLNDSKHLYLLAPGQTKRIELFAETPNHFFLKISNAEITFNKNEQNKIISLTMNQSGRKIIAKKN